MSPKPIKRVGKERKEPVVETTRERTSEAFRMAVSGDSSSAEHIAMIDAKVASGELTDDLTFEIRAEIAELFGDEEGYCFKDFAAALAAAAVDVVVDDGFRSSFEFQKKSFDSVRAMARKYREDQKGKERKELSPKDKATLKATIAQIVRDQATDRTAMILSEVDRALLIVKENFLGRLGIKEKPLSQKLAEAKSGLGQMIPGIEPLEVSGEDVDSPSDVHMDTGAFETALKSMGVPAGILSAPVPGATAGCKCGGHCHSRGG